MTAISSLQSSNYHYDTLVSEKRSSTIEKPNTRTMGADTVFFSEQARSLANNVATVEDDGATNAQEFWKTTQQNTSTQNTDKVSLKEQGRNLFSMLLESLFLAELEEGAANNTQADMEEDVPSKPASPDGQTSIMKDGSKTAELKKVIEDLSTGKATIADLPKAMAHGASETPRTALRASNEATATKNISDKENI